MKVCSFLPMFINHTMTLLLGRNIISITVKLNHFYVSCKISAGPYVCLLKRTDVKKQKKIWHSWGVNSKVVSDAKIRCIFFYNLCFFLYLGLIYKDCFLFSLWLLVNNLCGESHDRRCTWVMSSVKHNIMMQCPAYFRSWNFCCSLCQSCNLNNICDQFHERDHYRRKQHLLE